MQVNIENSWQVRLQEEFDQRYFDDLVIRVKDEYKVGPVFPAPENIFRAFNLVPFDNVKIVILGQDPYHTAGVADGLAFSTLDGNKVPPSLVNIYKELALEYDEYPDKLNPNLTRWANQGILLLNTSLTVREGQPNSHSKYGWSEFTDSVIKTIAKEKQKTVFMLWGGNARKKITLIESHLESNGHLILESAHPSPLSAYNGFFGNNHFKLCNEFLIHNSIEPIKW